MIAIIPARLGSKRLPRKNILSLCGKPLIAYTIEAALDSGSINDIYVSTDDDAVAEIAQSYGVHVPFLRPDYLGADTTSTEDVCEHMLGFLTRETDIDVSSFMFLQPTSPLRTAVHIKGAVKVFEEMNADSVVSVTRFAHPLEWALDAVNGVLVPFDSEGLNKRSQECKVRYHPNGAIFVFNTKFFSKRVGRYGNRSFPYVMDRSCSVDIDTKEDFELAEYLLKKRSLN